MHWNRSIGNSAAILVGVVVVVAAFVKFFFHIFLCLFFIANRLKALMIKRCRDSVFFCLKNIYVWIRSGLRVVEKVSAILLLKIFEPKREHGKVSYFENWMRKILCVHTRSEREKYRLIMINRVKITNENIHTEKESKVHTFLSVP